MDVIQKTLTDSTTKTALKILKYAPGSFVLFYAYLYVIGFTYLLSYFKYWKLNVLEMGFSVIDYATTSIYPIYITGITIFLGIFSGRTVSGLIKKTQPKIQKALRIIFIVIPIVLVFVFVNSIFENSLKAWFFADVSFGLLIFIVSLVPKNTLMALFLAISLSPLLAGAIGYNQARLLLPYQIDMSLKSSRITSVELLTRRSISGFELHEKSKNVYGDLLLVADKMGVYYLAPDPFKLDNYKILFSNLDKQIKAHLNAIDQLIIATNVNISKIKVEETKGRLREVDKILLAVKAGNLEPEKRKELLKKAKELLAETKSFQKQNQEQLEDARKTRGVIFERRDALETAMEELSQLNGQFNRIFMKTFSIKKDDIIKMEYLKNEEY